MINEDLNEIIKEIVKSYIKEMIPPNDLTSPQELEKQNQEKKKIKKS